MGTYQWKEGVRLRGNAQKIGEELSEIRMVTPENVVKKARSKKSELHKLFTWDNDKAADQWRMQEARTVVNSIVTVEDPESPEPISYRTFESVVINDQRQYVPIEQWSASEDLRSQVFAQIDRGIAELQRKSEVYRYLDNDRMGTLSDRLKHAREAVTA